MIDIMADTKYIGIWIQRENDRYYLSDTLDNTVDYGDIPPTVEEIDKFRDGHLDDYRASMVGRVFAQYLYKIK